MTREGDFVKCNDCEKMFGSSTKLYAHTQAVHVIGSFVCEFCSKEFKNRYYLRNHVRLIHESVQTGTVHMCDICSKSFKNSNNLWHHKNAVHDTKESKCNLCNALLKNGRSLRKHVIKCNKKVKKEDHIEEQIAEAILDLENKTEKEVISHSSKESMKLLGNDLQTLEEEIQPLAESIQGFEKAGPQHTKDALVIETVLRSEQSQLESVKVNANELEMGKDQQGYSASIENNHKPSGDVENMQIDAMDIKLESCMSLEKGDNASFALNSQQSKPTPPIKSENGKSIKSKGKGDDKVICEICSKVCFRKRIKEHTKSVHGNDGGNCPTCDKYFPTSRYLKNHITQNHLKKPSVESVHMCQFCSNEFIASKLKAHIRNYHSGQNLICDVCDKSYENLKHFKAHKQMAHSVMELSCQLCSKTFSHKHYLRQHIRLVHESRDDAVKCEDCGKSFGNNNRLIHHKKAVHTTVESPCNDCNKIFKNSYALRKHAKKYHL